MRTYLAQTPKMWWMVRVRLTRIWRKPSSPSRLTTRTSQLTTRQSHGRCLIHATLGQSYILRGMGIIKSSRISIRTRAVRTRLTRSRDGQPPIPTYLICRWQRHRSSTLCQIIQPVEERTLQCFGGKLLTRFNGQEIHSLLWGRGRVSNRPVGLALKWHRTIMLPITTKLYSKLKASDFSQSPILRSTKSGCFRISILKTCRSRARLKAGWQMWMSIVSLQRNLSSNNRNLSSYPQLKRPQGSRKNAQEAMRMWSITGLAWGRKTSSNFPWTCL